MNNNIVIVIIIITTTTIVIIIIYTHITQNFMIPYISIIVKVALQ